jgi:hypothetical protein
MSEHEIVSCRPSAGASKWLVPQHPGRLPLGAGVPPADRDHRVEVDRYRRPSRARTGRYLWGEW